MDNELKNKLNTENKGVLHPMTAITRQIISIFSEIGFSVATGPELETEWYNFDALNIPKDHPARDMQDTFWIKTKVADKKDDVGEKSRKPVLRTHTSPVQVRFIETMIKNGKMPPYGIIAPGRVFRNEATDSTHDAQFYQFECLYVNEKVSVAELKWTLETFLKKMFGNDTEIRFRPSFFAFVEPGFEVDLKRGEKWLEVVGAGLVHPQVLASAGLDPKKYQGFAFGFGIDRLLMIKHNGIDDIRQSYSGDLRFINQFKQ